MLSTLLFPFLNFLFQKYLVEKLLYLNLICLKLPLKNVSKELNLNTEVIQKDIFKLKNMETGTIMSRAFKPMPLVLNLVNDNFKRFKNIIFFMGKNGKKVLKDTLQHWDLDYEEKKSLTNESSFILNIKKIKKKLS